MDIDCRTCRSFPGLGQRCEDGDVPMDQGYVTEGSCPSYEKASNVGRSFPGLPCCLSYGVNGVHAQTCQHRPLLPGEQIIKRPQNAKAYSHYFKSCPYDHVDIYRVLTLFEVTDPCLQHAIKKLLVAGGRGLKDAAKDIKEAIDALHRWQEMRIEEANGQAKP